jgi:two-component system, cell cycle sensor histidine kinase and response regulator CckA
MAARNENRPFDALLLDLTIPGGMGGSEVMQRLLDIDPEVRAIVLSGYSNDPIMASSGKHGFKGVLTKPYSLKELGETLSKVLKDR